MATDLVRLNNEATLLQLELTSTLDRTGLEPSDLRGELEASRSKIPLQAALGADMILSQALG
jgi:hypothetical protein